MLSPKKYKKKIIPTVSQVENLFVQMFFLFAKKKKRKRCNETLVNNESSPLAITNAVIP